MFVFWDNYPYCLYKTLSSLLILILVLVLSTPAFADGMDMKIVDSVLQEIQIAQNVTYVKQIDILKFTPISWMSWPMW